MSNYLKKARLVLIASMLCIGVNISAQTVSGTVVDTFGEPIIGATVMEQGQAGNGTVTDLDGNFSFQLKGNSKKVTITYIGMKSQTVAAKENLQITMEDNAESLNDVVVIGYGTVRKKDLTGAVSSISSEKLANLPVSNVGEAMTGKLAGVNITTTEGSPDADVKIRVRGGGSLSQDNSPLYIVDGFPVESISDIAASDIESIDVLKDASSTAIYGARGANGVIIITTKSGVEGAPQVTLNSSLSWKKIAKTIGVLSPYEYAYYQYELGSDSYGSFQDLDIWKSEEGYDWQDEIFGNTGLQKQVNTSVSGGSKDLKYSVSYAHNDEESIMEGSGYAKNNVSTKLNANINKWLTLDFNARLAYTKIEGLSGGAETNQSNAANSIVAATINHQPINALSADDEDEANSTSSRRSPIQRINSTYKQVRRFSQDYNMGLNWKPFKGITARTEFGYNWRYYNTDNVWGSDATQNSKYGYNGSPQMRLERTDYRGWRNANTLTYDNKKLFGGRDRINVMVGQEWSSTRSSYRASTSVDYPTSFSISDVLAYSSLGTALSNESDLYADENLLSFFGRVNYTLDDKYLATVTFRADGSSKFKKGNNWGYFPSVALAWRMSDEKWLQDVKWLSNLKLRLSFGTAGNNRIPSGATSLTYSASSSSSKSPGFGETSNSMIEHSTYLDNPDLKWETTITRNFGVDYGFFNGRLNGSLDLYWNTTKDLLMLATIPSGTGYTAQYQNFGQTSNKGIEFTVNGVLVESRNFNLNATANIAWNKNKIDKLAGGETWQTSSFAGSTITGEDYYLAEGSSLGDVYGYKVIGFYTVYDAETNPDGDLILDGTTWKLRDGVNNNSNTLTGGNLYPGGLKYECDENGDPIKQKLGNTVPKVTGGFGLNGNWKGFDFNVYFSYSLGNQIVNGTKLANSFYHGSAKNYNIVDDFTLANRYTWIDPETGLNLGRPSNSVISYYGSAEAVMARLNEINANATIYNPAAVSAMYLNSYAVENADFLRLQTLTVGYTLPKNWTKKFWVNSLRVYLTAYNLFCITGYDGYDPEVDTSSKKNPMTPGIDYASYPKSRSFTVGLNINF